MAGSTTSPLRRWSTIVVFVALFLIPESDSAAADRASPDRLPNVLWIITDEHRTDSLGCYGSAWARTPHIDRLAREGAMFTNAVTPGPVCVPARASLVTGRYPSDLGIWFNIRRDHPELEYLTEVFHRAGYHSASFGKHHYGGRNKAFQAESGFVLSKAVGYYRYAEPYDPAKYDVVQYPRNPYPWILGGRFPEPADQKSEAQAVRAARAWLEKRDSQTPFFLHLSLNAPHTPVVPPEPFDTIIADSIDLPGAAEGPPKGEPKWIAALRPSCDSSVLSPSQIAKARRYYYGEVAFLDGQVGELLNWMRPRGLLDKTIIVLVSDHGTHLGDYGLVQKQTFYEPVVKVPYLFWYPGVIKAGVVLKTPVETRTLLPTLIELAGLELPGRAGISPSLARTLRSGREPAPAPVFSEFNLASFDIRPEERLVMVRDRNWKLSLSFSPAPGDGALYDLGSDPHERINLYDVREHSRIRERLTRLILDHLKHTERREVKTTP